MRPLALLLVLAALLALGAWWIGGADRGGAIDPAHGAPALEPARLAEAQLETSASAAAREEQLAPAATPAVEASARRIHGRVVRGPHSIPIAGIAVFCAKQQPRMRLENPVIIERDGNLIFAPEQAAKPQELTCTSGVDGSFVFADLDPGALYSLEARGGGWVMPRPLAGLSPSEEPQRLVVGRVYAARVLAVDERGEALGDNCQYLRYARTPGPGECESRLLEQPSANEAKRPRDGLAFDLSAPKSGREYAFSSDCDEARLGPFRILIVCSGFERQDFEFWAYPEGLAADTTVLRLTRVADSTGVLRLHQECGCEESCCEHLLEGRIDLEPLDGQPKTLEFDLTGLVREQVFTGIPAGRWALRVRALVGGFAWQREIAIAAEPLAIQLPVRELGAIRWQLRPRGDGVVRGPLPIVWRGAGGAAASSQLWISAVMRGVPAGEHDFEFEANRLASVENAIATERAGITVVRVAVAAGETKTVVVHAP